MLGGTCLNFWVTVRRDDPFYDFNLPRLAYILLSLNMTLHLLHKDIDSAGANLLHSKYMEVICSRALQALLYYPVAQRLKVQTYKELEAISTVWMDALSMCHHQRPLPTVTNYTCSPCCKHCSFPHSGQTAGCIKILYHKCKQELSQFSNLQGRRQRPIHNCNPKSDQRQAQDSCKPASGVSTTGP